MKKQTAGRDRLGDLAPKFAELNDDVLLGVRLITQSILYVFDHQGQRTQNLQGLKGTLA